MACAERPTAFQVLRGCSMMGFRALGAVPEISQTAIAERNKHYILINQIEGIVGAAEERGEFDADSRPKLARP